MRSLEQRAQSLYALKPSHFKRPISVTSRVADPYRVTSLSNRLKSLQTANRRRAPQSHYYRDGHRRIYFVFLSQRAMPNLYYCAQRLLVALEYEPDRTRCGPCSKSLATSISQALSTSDTIGSELIAEIQDVHGNRIVSDSTTIVSFSISGGPGTILPPHFARADSGRVLGRVRPTGPQGNVLVFAGASGLSSSTFEIPVRQARLRALQATHLNWKSWKTDHPFITAQVRS